jgi:hypothetical protein
VDEARAYVSEQESGDDPAFDPEFWLSVGVDIAYNTWVDTSPVRLEEFRELGRAQIQSEVPGNNEALPQLEVKHGLVRKERRTR